MIVVALRTVTTRVRSLARRTTLGEGEEGPGCDVMDLLLQEPSKRVKAKPSIQSESSVAGWLDGTGA